MGATEIADALQRAATEKRVRMKSAAKIAALAVPYLASADDILELYAAKDEKAYLVVTTEGVLRLQASALSSGKVTFIPHGDIVDVAAIEGVFSRCLFRDLEIEGINGAISYRFLWLCPSPGLDLLDQQKLDAADRELIAAVQQIETLRGRFLQSESTDPDLAQFERAMRLVDAEPEPGDAGKDLGESDLEAAYGWMAQQFAEGNYRAVWEYRLGLGYGMSPSSSCETDFWLNALPAISAIRIDLRDHPFVATCAGLADRQCDSSDDAQLAAKDEIERAFF